VRTGGRGAPTAPAPRGGLPAGPPGAPGPQRPTAPPGPSSPESDGRQQPLRPRPCSHHPGTAAAGKRTPAPRSRQIKLSNTRVLPEPAFPADPSPRGGPAAALPSPPFSTPAAGAAWPRGALGSGKACPDTAGAAPASPRLTSRSCRESRAVLSSRRGGLGVLGLRNRACLTERDGGGKPATRRA